MHKIAILLVARSAGGMEKRFTNLMKFLVNKFSNPNIIYYFYISRSLANRMGVRYLASTPNIRIILYGLGNLSNKKIFRLIDYCLLATNLIIHRYRYTTIHYVTQSSLKMRYLSSTKIKVHSFVASTYVEAFSNSKIYNRIKNDLFRIDCLDENIKEKLLTNRLFNNHIISNSPCSFTTYDNTESDYREKRNIVTFCARFAPNTKGIEILLPAISRVLAERNDLHFLILGDGPMKKDILSYIKACDLMTSVSIYYSRNPIVEMKKSKVFLSIQRFENYPSQSLLEAMACSNAIIATNVGLTKKIIDKNVGLLINYDYKDLADNIIEIFRDENKIRYYGMNARSKVMSEHTAERFHKYISYLYISPNIH